MVAGQELELDGVEAEDAREDDAATALACEARSSPRIARASSKRPSMAGAQRAERRVHRERRDLDPRPCAERDDRPQADAGGRVVTLSAAFVVSVSDNLGQQQVNKGPLQSPRPPEPIWLDGVALRGHARAR